MACLECKRDIVPHCRGLCQSCYLRLKKSRSLPPLVKKERAVCTEDGCDKHVTSMGLCRTHYMRFRRHGHTEPTRPYLDGAKREHHLYETWKWIHRKKNAHEVQDSWDIFEEFVKDIGERPSPEHRITLIDKDGPYNKSNIEWSLPIPAEFGETSEDVKKRRTDAARTLSPQRYRAYALQNSGYGIDIHTYNSMVANQLNRCAICGEEESVVRNNRILPLSVDHDHVTGKVRGLLCSACNHGIGHFRDSAKNLDAASAYIRKHHPDKAD
jgi:hypothetical protein